MSSRRELDSRTLRRYQRDVAEKEGRHREAPKPGRRPRPEPRRTGAEQDLVRQTEEELERLPPRQKHRPRETTADAHRRSHTGADRGSAAAAEAPEPNALGLVVATTRGPCEVELDDGRLVSAHLPKALARADRGLLSVGDRVELAARPDGTLAVDRRLPRRSRLARPDPFDPLRERVVAANLDLGVVVASLRRPALATGLVDRFLVALEYGRVGAAIAVNKVDLAAGAEEISAAEAVLAPYRDLGLPVVLCSAKSGEGLETLRGWMAGKTVALVGHSGVGKSSLLNALLPEAAASTGGVATRRGRGRHTTSQARVYRLPDGARLIDTPGVREFGLHRLSPPELAAYFDELAPFAAGCRFNDCTHVHEPACAVRRAAEKGEIPPARFATYLRIVESFERD